MLDVVAPQDSLMDRVARIASSELVIFTRLYPIVFKWGFIPMAISTGFAGAFLMVAKQFSDTGGISLHWSEIVLISLLSFLSIFLHESGHAIVGHMTGRKIIRIQFGLAGGAVSGGDSTPLRRALAVAAGPLAEIIFGGILFSIAGNSMTNPLSIVGFMALTSGILNLVPFCTKVDGYKLLRFLWLALRGNKPLVCLPSGPCPACSGKFPKVAPATA